MTPSANIENEGDTESFKSNLQTEKLNRVTKSVLTFLGKDTYRKGEEVKYIQYYTGHIMYTQYLKNCK